VSRWFSPQWPAPANVGALITTRAGGVSRAPFDSFNLGAHVGDAPEDVARNRARLREALPAEPVWMNQVHGIEVIEAAGIVGTPTADAAITRTPGVVCAVLTADCLPVLLTDSDGTVVGVAHAGWRGLAQGVLEATVARMSAPAARLHAYLGPAISAGAYEVGRDVLDAFIARDAAAARSFAPKADGKLWCDLYALARQRLGRAGVTSLYGGDACTFGERERYFSFRRDGRTGRMASLIWMRS
jgi:hypothetical protein